MNSLKRIVFPIFSAFLVYQSYGMMKLFLSMSEIEWSGWVAFIYAFLFSLFVTGMFAFMGFAYPTHRVLPKAYYRIHKPRHVTFFYRVLGVHYFKVALMLFFWGSKKNRKKYFDGSKQGLTQFVFQTKQSEFGHLGAFAVILIASLVLLGNGNYLLVAWLMLINFIGNVYPVVLQRFHRMRVQRLAKRMAAS